MGTNDSIRASRRLQAMLWMAVAVTLAGGVAVAATSEDPASTTAVVASQSTTAPTTDTGLDDEGAGGHAEPAPAPTTSEQAPTTQPATPAHQPTPWTAEGAGPEGLRITLEVSDLHPLPGQEVTATITVSDDAGDPTSFSVAVDAGGKHTPLKTEGWPSVACAEGQTSRASSLVRTVTFTAPRNGGATLSAHISTAGCSSRSEAASATITLTPPPGR